MSAPTLEETLGRMLRLGRAIEMLAEMHGEIGVTDKRGTPVSAAWPPGYFAWPPKKQVAFTVGNRTQFATPGDPEDLARAIETAHANWKRSKNDDEAGKKD